MQGGRCPRRIDAQRAVLQTAVPSSRGGSMRSRVRRGRSMTLGVLLALAAPGVAQAAVTKPAVTTKAPSNVSQSAAQLNGSVNPNGAATTYFFQIGPTSVY